MLDGPPEGFKVGDALLILDHHLAIDHGTATNDSILNPELLKIAYVAFDGASAVAASRPVQEMARAAFRIS